jgi:hypothetical protein
MIYGTVRMQRCFSSRSLGYYDRSKVAVIVSNCPNSKFGSNNDKKVFFKIQGWGERMAEDEQTLLFFLQRVIL